jgi:anti-sigma factor ChrR (cupin superfamily)
MELTADFSQRVAVHAAQLPWVASPIRWVDRCMLDCIGDDVARATSIVHYAPDSRFSAARVRWSGDPDRSPRTPFGISSPQFADLEGFY